MQRAFAWISTCFVLSSGSITTFHPSSVEYKDLLNAERFVVTAQPVLERALGIDGIVAIKVPGFSTLRANVMKDAYSCIAVSPNVHSVDFEDGTVRRTLAGVSKSGTGHQRIDHGSLSKACQTFEMSSLAFRETVGSVADAFGKRLSSMLELDTNSLLQRSAGSGAYHSLEDVMKAGERLEHFHTYHVPAATEGAKEQAQQTIDFHVDQGLFIVFAPAILVEDSSSNLRAADREMPTGTFTLQTMDGSNLEVVLPDDSLIILAGDAVNQFINKRHLGTPIHAPTHAFRMPRGLGGGLSRVWYGMMQLPPADALNDEVGLTFGEIREKAADMSGSATGLGCSRQLLARELSATCKSDQIYCWFRCVNFTDDVSPSACAAKNSGFNCTDQFDQIYLPKDMHGDYHPTCTNSTTLVKPRPTVQQPSEPVDSTSWENMILNGTEYAHRATLVDGETYFLWSLDGNKIKGKMIHKGSVGWMSIGLESIGGGHNGMNGAQIVMGSNDLDVGMHVQEYHIHPHMSAFRHWKTPLSPSALSDTVMTVADGVSVIQFTTESIYGKKLNITEGTNRFIWGLTHNAYVTEEFGGYAAYHSGETRDRTQNNRFRGKVHLNLQTGEQLFETPHGAHPDHSYASPETHSDDADDADDAHDADSPTTSTNSPTNVETAGASAFHVLAAFSCIFVNA